MHTSLLTLAVAVTIAAPVPKGKDAELYYPIVKGTKRVTGPPEDSTRDKTETVAAVREEHGTYTVTTEQSWGGSELPDLVFEVSAGGLARLIWEGGQERDRLPVLKPGVKSGETWTSSGRTVGSVTYTMGDDEEIKVTAGKYQARRVEYQMEQSGTVTKVVAWYAPGIGLVKQESTWKGGKSSLELKSFTPGKGDTKAEPKKDE